MVIFFFVVGIKIYKDSNSGNELLYWSMENASSTNLKW